MKHTAFAVSLLFGMAGLAQQKGVFSLEAAEEFGVEHNVKTKNALLDYQMAQKRVWEATATGLPQVQAEGQFQQLLDIPVSVVDAQLFDPSAEEGQIVEFRAGQEFTTSLSLQVNQLLFDGSYIVGLRFAKFWKEMYSNAIGRSQSEVKTMVREAYYNALVAEENWSLMEAIFRSTEQLEQKTQAFYESGFTLKEEVDQVKLATNRMKVAKQAAERQVVVAHNLLKLQMGYELNQPIELSESLDSLLSEVTLPAVVDRSLEVKDNDRYRMLAEQKRLDEFNLMKEKAANYPSLGAFFNHSQNAFRNEFNFFNDGRWYPTTVWGLSLKIPITSSGQRLMRIQQAEIKLEQDAHQLLDLKRSLEFQHMQLKAQFRNAHEQMVIEKENVDLATFIYDQALRKRSVGSISSLEVTQLQNQLLQSEGKYIEAILALLQAKIALDTLLSSSQYASTP